MAGPPPFQAITIKANGGLLRQLLTDLTVSSAYDVNFPPSPLPPEVATKALWDTGASGSVISQKLAQDLKLVATGAINVNHAGGTGISPTYMVNFKMPNMHIGGVLVTEWPGAPNFDAIVGMDIITLGDFAVTNRNGASWMSFRVPSMEHVDYVAQHSREQFAGIGRNDPCPCGSGKKFKKCHG